MKRFLPCWNLLVGGMDAATGLCLIAAPAWTLRMMGVTRPPVDLVLVSYVGVFVLAIGLAYFLAIRPPHDSESAGRWRAIWSFTAIARLAVATFVAWKVAVGAMEPAWSTVALTDGLIAIVQLFGLCRAWLSPSPP